MNRKIKTILAASFAAVALVAPLLFGASTSAQAETDKGVGASLLSSSSSGLADRSKIQLDEGEVWDDGLNLHRHAIKAGNEFVSCNNNGGDLNTVNNHFGLRSTTGHGVSSYGHAWSFTFEWHGNKGAYCIKVGMQSVDPEYRNDKTQTRMKYADCTWRYLNLTDKKTSNHVKIKTWGIKNPEKKSEQLFWISRTQEGTYRLWSAKAGRPLGYTSDDKDNLKTLDNREAGTTQYFTLEQIDSELCAAANAYYYER